MIPIMFLCGAFFTSCKSHKKFVNRNVPAGGVEKASSNSNRDKSANYADLSAKYANMLDVPTSSISNKALYQFIDDWYGTPYQYGGQTLDGVDCSGFVGNLLREVYNKNVPRTTTLIEEKARPIPKSKLDEGNLVIFDIDGKKSSHIGVYLQNGHFVHASSSKGVIISDLSSEYYSKHFSKAAKL